MNEPEHYDRETCELDECMGRLRSSAVRTCRVQRLLLG